MKWRFLWCAEVYQDSLAFVDFARCVLAGEIAKVVEQKLVQKFGYTLGGVFVLLDFLSCSSWKYSLFYDFVILALATFGFGYFWLWDSHRFLLAFA